MGTMNHMRRPFEEEFFVLTYDDGTSSEIPVRGGTGVPTLAASPAGV
jgi:hypothetical protein